MSTPETEIVLRLPQSALTIVLAHLEAGRYSDVAPVVQLIVAQASPQLVQAAKIADAEACAMEAQARGCDGPRRQ